MRRRLRRQRQMREALLLDLGALVFELHRQGRREPDLLQAKAAELTAVDEEVRALAEALGSDQTVMQLVAAGVAGSCENCGSLMSIDARYCAACGAPAFAALSGDGERREFVSEEATEAHAPLEPAELEYYETPETPEGVEDAATEDDVVEQPTAGEPPAEEPAAEEPASEEPPAEEPAAEEPAAEEPAAEEPAAEEPAAEEPAAEEPPAEEPAAEEPAAEEQVAEEPQAEGPAAEEPPADEQAEEPDEAVNEDSIRVSRMEPAERDGAKDGASPRDGAPPAPAPRALADDALDTVAKAIRTGIARGRDWLRGRRSGG